MCIFRILCRFAEIIKNIDFFEKPKIVIEEEVRKLLKELKKK